MYRLETDISRNEKETGKKHYYEFLFVSRSANIKVCVMASWCYRLLNIDINIYEIILLSLSIIDGNQGIMN